jgi:YggT family protein
MYVIIAQVIVSWLIAFNVINVHSNGVRTIIGAMERMTEPLYRPIRRLLPDFGGIDFSPLVILLIIGVLRSKVLPGILLEVGPTIT